jgi:peroxiredoxin
MAKKLTVNIMAPDFELEDTQDNLIHLSDYRGKKFIILVLNRGFV